jgi:glycolate oxidase iron-sulfur subunit
MSSFESLLPAIDRATERVLAAARIETRVAASAGCCGALREHLSDHPGALHAMRRNVDAWWPLLAAG